MKSKNSVSLESGNFPETIQPHTNKHVYSSAILTNQFNPLGRGVMNFEDIVLYEPMIIVRKPNFKPKRETKKPSRRKDCYQF